MIVYKASFGDINDVEMHNLKSQHIDARKDILAYFNDYSVMDTPLNDARDAEHGWDGITTVHALIKSYADKYYKLLEYLGVILCTPNHRQLHKQG